MKKTAICVTCRNGTTDGTVINNYTDLDELTMGQAVPNRVLKRARATANRTYVSQETRGKNEKNPSWAQAFYETPARRYFGNYSSRYGIIICRLRSTVDMTVMGAFLLFF